MSETNDRPRSARDEVLYDLFTPASQQRADRSVWRDDDLVTRIAADEPTSHDDDELTSILKAWRRDCVQTPMSEAPPLVSVSIASYAVLAMTTGFIIASLVIWYVFVR